MGHEQEQRWLQRYRQMPEYVMQGDRPGVRWDGGFELLRTAEVASDTITVRVRTTTEQRDRANDSITTAGIDTTYWERDNPVVLWAHDGGWNGSIPAIATGANLVKGVEKGLGVMDSDAIFHLITDLSRDIAALVKARVIRTVSIGLIPLVWEDSPLTEEDYASGRVYPSWTNEARDYTESEMIEYSFCNIPMNPGALVQNSFSKEFDARLRDAIHRGVVSGEGAYLQRIGGLGRIELANTRSNLDRRRESIPPAAHTGPARENVERAGAKIARKRLERLKNAHQTIGDVIAEAEDEEAQEAQNNEEKRMNSKRKGTPAEPDETVDEATPDAGGDTGGDANAALMQRLDQLEQNIMSRLDGIESMISQAEAEDQAEDQAEESEDGPATRSYDGDFDDDDIEDEEDEDGDIYEELVGTTPEELDDMIARGII